MAKKDGVKESGAMAVTKKGGKKGAQKRAEKYDKLGLILPVPRIEKRLRHAAGKMRVAQPAAFALTAAVQTCFAHLIYLAKARASDDKHKRITPRDLMLAIDGDAELRRVFGDMAIAKAGAVTTANPAAYTARAKLLEKRREKGRERREQQKLLTGAA